MDGDVVVGCRLVGVAAIVARLRRGHEIEEVGEEAEPGPEGEMQIGLGREGRRKGAFPICLSATNLALQIHLQHILLNPLLIWLQQLVARITRLQPYSPAIGIGSVDGPAGRMCDPNGQPLLAIVFAIIIRQKVAVNVVAFGDQQAVLREGKAGPQDGRVDSRTIRRNMVETIEGNAVFAIFNIAEEPVGQISIWQSVSCRGAHT